MMSDDADDVNADGADDNVGDNDGLFFSLAWRRGTGTCRKERGLSRVVTGTLNARRGDRQRQVRQAAPETARGRSHHGLDGSGHLPVSWRCRRWAFFISSACGVLVSVFFFFATKIGWRRYKVYKKWQEHNLHP